MTENAQKLLNDALQLSENERAELAGLLLGSLEVDHDSASQSAWSEEIAKRLDELNSGAVKPIPWPEVRRRLAGNAG